jgi:hypothetical protein
MAEGDSNESMWIIGSVPIPWNDPESTTCKVKIRDIDGNPQDGYFENPKCAGHGRG